MLPTWPWLRGVSVTSPALTFIDYKIFSCGAGSKCPTGAGLGNLFPALAVDNFGYVYATWSDNTDVYYSFLDQSGCALVSGHQSNSENVPSRKVERIPLDRC